MPCSRAAHWPSACSCAGARSGSPGGAPASVASASRKWMTGNSAGTSGTVMPSRATAGPACSRTAAVIPASACRSTASTSRWSRMKPELGVQRHVLGQVPGGVVRFGPEHRAGLVDPLEHADHGLLVELRGLGQVGAAAEVVHAEHVGPGLGGRGHQLGRLDLGEAQAVQGGPEAVQRRGGDLPGRAAGRMPPAHRGVVEQRGQRGLHRGPPQLDRRGLRGLGQRGDPRLGQLHRRRARPGSGWPGR